MITGVIYPLLVALLIFPGWLAYNHPVVFKRLSNIVGTIFFSVAGLCMLLAFGASIGMRIAMDQVTGNDALVRRLGTQIQTAEDNLVIGTIILFLLGCYLTFLFVSVTTWKNSPYN